MTEPAIRENVNKKKYTCTLTNSAGVKCNLPPFIHRQNWTTHYNSCHTQKHCTRCPHLDSFVDKAALDLHKKEHHSGHLTCTKPWCGRHFENLDRQKDHIKSCVIPDDPIICSLCSYRVEQKTIDGYRSHLKRTHRKTATEATGIIRKERPQSLISDKISKSSESAQHEIPFKKIKLPCDLEQSPYTIEPEEEFQSTDRQLLKYGRMTILYCYKTKGPRLAHMLLTKANLNPTLSRPVISHTLDHDIPKDYQALNADFKAPSDKSVIEKGHIISAFFMRVSEETCAAIKLLSTVLPQIKEFNHGTWDTAERHVTWLLKNEYDMIDLVVGGLYLKDIGKCGTIPLASHFFVTLICHLPDGQIDLEIFVIPHKEHDPALGLTPFYKTYQELLKLDRDNFVPLFDFENVRNENGKPPT